MEELIQTAVEKFKLIPPKKFLPKFEYFHSHIYYNASSKEKAVILHHFLKSTLSQELRISPLFDYLMGPHPFWMFEADFKLKSFLTVIEALAKHSEDLSILIHPLSGDGLLDHTDYAMFLGRKENLILDIFK